MIRDLRKGFVMAAGAALFTVTATLAVRALTPRPADDGGDAAGGGTRVSLDDWAWSA